MVFSDALTKAGRLVELQLLFWRSTGRVLTTSRIAERIGVAPRTVRKYLIEMSGSGRLPICREGRGWRLTEGARMEVPPVRLLLEEAAALYLGARLLLNHADEPNPAVRGAVEKLGAAVPDELRAAFGRLAERAVRGGEEPFAEVFQALAYGWALSRVVRLEYAARSGAESRRCELRPYLLEPSAIGSAIYAIGRLDPPGELRVLKLERVRLAWLTPATFAPPPVGELLDRLDSAWGVWLSDDDPVEVRLRFDAEVAGRVVETRWHPSQRLEDDDDGGLAMTVTVASTVEILPWILGWGSHCEVLAPEALRAEVRAELSAAGELYGG